MNTRRWTLVLVVTAMVLPMTLVASAGQVVDFTGLTRQTAGYHVDMINPGAPTPWGDYSSPVFGSQPVSGCFSGSQDRTTSYGSPSDINLDLIAWTRTCFTKVQENGGSTAPLSMDLMPNGDQFTMTYPFDGLGADDFAPDAPDDLLVFSFDLPGDVLDPSYCSGASTQVALGFQTGGPEFAAGSSFPDDYFGGAGRITTIDINDCSMSATDFIFNGSGLDVFPGNTLAAIGPNGSGGSIISGITRVPTGFTGVRPVIFHTNQTGNFDPSVVGHVWAVRRHVLQLLGRRVPERPRIRLSDHDDTGAVDDASRAHDDGGSDNDGRGNNNHRRGHHDDGCGV